MEHFSIPSNHIMLNNLRNTNLMPTMCKNCSIYNTSVIYSLQPYVIGTFIIPILQVRKLKNREVK